MEQEEREALIESIVDGIEALLLTDKISEEEKERTAMKMLAIIDSAFWKE